MSELIHNVIEIESLERPILAIVRLAPEDKAKRDLAGVLTPYYQVTIDPRLMSPSKEFVRFGTIQGDEIVGWRPVQDVIVEEILGEYPQGSEPPKHITHQQGQSITVVPFRQLSQPS